LKAPGQACTQALQCASNNCLGTGFCQ
jgi:hypothetical protein